MRLGACVRARMCLCMCARVDMDCTVSEHSPLTLAFYRIKTILVFMLVFLIADLVELHVYVHLATESYGLKLHDVYNGSKSYMRTCRLSREALTASTTLLLK